MRKLQYSKMADGMGDAKLGKKTLYFPEGSLLNTMLISLNDTEKRYSDVLKEPYTVYLIETKYIDGSPPPGETDQSCSLWRRYSEFELLRNYLVATFPALIVPPLPEKRINIAALRIAADKFDPDFTERRRVALESFLLRCAAHAKLSQEPIFLGFLNQEEGWKESVQATHYQAKVDSRLKSLSASMSIKHPDRRYEDLKNYADQLGSNIAAIMKVRQHIADRLFSIHKLHAGYGKTFSEWSSLETDMGDMLQKSGHYMDGFAASIDSILEDDEINFADQIKEYLFFADVLKVVAKKQQLRQYDLEKAEELLSSKSTQREELHSQQALEESGEKPKTGGFSFKGLSSMIFGADTPESRLAKITALDEQIQEAENNVQTTKEEVAAFVEQSLNDYERFKKQEVRDIKEILRAHVKTQIQLCKLGISTWENIKETANSLGTF